ncbi:putative toxin-antitoxin system toxin component, PIN family [Candidatus Berkelbacteria bacterium CG10_big_fil_rev_8_21_14_0_10_43_13]|uniref:Putative toxin-antitoxin system toxin component, PIN family n=1 Tax=Candidatus Berkelbacteria bacterium CG10_big_fil_rev_8_21_14_0_10_43_13 TaxID=1974514 RepID=A0A2H0W7D2_9BACT|nr:MAG: putative toxin-antitoxin system toxin component, PIN family [Candidatus Berkelbacteria bacterium CG10_big_fil_rev_8_21_14_0_10_43_13]
MKVVLDTNIYLSGLIFPNSKPSLVLDLAKEGKFEIYCSDFIIVEIERIFIAKFGYGQNTTDKIILEILKFVKVIQPDKKVDVIKSNADDNHILECAMSAQADYLVTGDKKHILPLKKFGTTKIVNASDFLEKLDLPEV